MVDVIFTLTDNDFVLLVRERLRRQGESSLGFGMSIFIGVLFSSLGLWGMSAILDGHPHDTSIGGILLIIGVICLYSALRRSTWYASRYLRHVLLPYQEVGVEHTLRVSPAGMVMTSQEEGSRQTERADVLDVVDSENFLLFVTDKRTMAGLVVPKRAFQSADTASTFQTAAHVLWIGEPPGTDRDQSVWPPPPKAEL
jgi:hypothetical protein